MAGIYIYVLRIRLQTESRLYHGLVDRVGGLIREYAGGKAGDHFLNPALVGRVQDVVIDVDVPPLRKDKPRAGHVKHSGLR